MGHQIGQGLIDPAGGQGEGIRTITEPNGNTVTFTPDGIIHSSGKSVTFVRDAEGRITQITDPNGNMLQYTYDANGDLVSYTDPEGNTTQFLYNFNHGLLEIRNPRGVRATRHEYDADGRLVAVVNPNSDRVDFNYDLSAGQEIIRDTRGNSTILDYNERGDVVAETDPLLNTTTFIYD